jgi:hypothetical protein
VLSFIERRFIGNQPGYSSLLGLDGNAALSNVYLNATRLLALLIKIIAQGQGGDNERADDEVEKVAIHIWAAPISVRTHAHMSDEAAIRSGAFPSSFRRFGAAIQCITFQFLMLIA